MRTPSFRTVVLLVLASFLLACDLSSLTGTAKPTIIIQSPAHGSQFREGDEIAIQSVATDASGIVSIDLIIDGATVRTDTPPNRQGEKLIALTQKWEATAGTHTLSVRAFNAAGIASDLAAITISVAPATALAATTPSPAPALTAISSAATAAVPTRQPTPKPTPNFVLTFSDDFGDPTSGLPEGGQCANYYEQGEYVLEALVDNILCLEYMEQPPTPDFTLEADARIVNGPAASAMGVIFRYVDYGNYYAFFVNGNGEYLIGKRQNKTWQPIGNASWTSSPNIQKGQSTNRLKIVAQNSEFSAFANGQPLITIRDPSFTQGAVGFVIQSPKGSPPTKVAFDNLSVTNGFAGSAVVLVKDNFASKATGWSEWTPVGETKYEQGNYVIRVSEEDHGVYGCYPKLIASDFALEIDARLTEGSEDASLELIFRYKDAANYYGFELNRQGQYRFNKLADREWQDIGINWTSSPAIRTGDGTNHLKVVAQGPTLSFYANNQFLATIEDSSIDRGKIGLSANRRKGGVVTAAFDNLKLYTSAASAPPVAPTRPVATVPPDATPVAPSGIPPGVYVGGMWLEPKEPKDGQYPTFNVSFINNTEGTLYYKWYVKIYEPDKKNSFGETAKVDSTLPRGITVVPSAANWKAVGGNPCRQFIARVFYVAPDKTILEFPKPGGDNLWHYFTVCP